MFSIRPIGFLFTLTLMATVPSIWTAKIPRKSPKEFDSCGGVNGFPHGKCRLASDCTTLQSFVDKKVFDWLRAPICSFKGLNPIEMLCCPNNYEHDSKAAPIPKAFGFAGTHLATLRYLKPISLDDHVYRCTGVLLTNTHVLVTKQCIGANAVDKPNRVLLGAEDVRLSDDSQILVCIKATEEYNDDLVLLKLKEPLTNEQLSGSISIAQVCAEEDLIGQPNIFAAGYSYDMILGNSCNQFTQQLQFANLSECRNVKLKLHVKDLAVKQSHFCVIPGAKYMSSNQTDECSKCLTYTSSVLHVQRENGSQCVAGIATPTTDECIEGDGPLYFTNILTNSVNDFFNGNIYDYND